MLSEKHMQGDYQMDTMGLRKELGLPFITNEQQDAEEFLTKMRF